MKPGFVLNLAGTSVAALSLLLGSTILLAAQSNNNKKPAPPPTQNSAPAKPAAAPVQQQRPQQPQVRGPVRTGANAGGGPNSGTKTGGTATAGTKTSGTTTTGTRTSGAATTGTRTSGTATTGTRTGNTTTTATKTGVTTPPPTAKSASVAGAKSTPGPYGSTRTVDPKGHLSSVTTNSGAIAHFGSTGHVSTITTRSGTTITHTSKGAPVVVGDKVSPGGTRYRVVNTGRDRGYVARSFVRDGRVYERRNYVVGGRTYVTVYRGYTYRERVYYGYVPAYYYYPGYYQWAYTPWGAPVPYAWGWGASPWYGAYGYYWTPYPVYSSATFWLTDYLIAQNLQAAYEARAAATSDSPVPAEQTDTSTASAGPPPLTEQTKKMIADEVKAQLAAEQASAAQSPAPASVGVANETAPPALDPNLKVFIVTSSLDVVANGQGCALSPGDVLMRTETSPDKDGSVSTQVVSSQRSDCAGGSEPRIQVADLQEMHNHFREQMDNGLKTLAEKQGKNGLPPPPAGTGRRNPEGDSAPDMGVSADLKKQQDEADQAEKDVQQASSTSASSGNN